MCHAHAAGASSSKWRRITPGLVPKANESMSRVVTRKRGVCCRIGYFYHLDGRQLFCIVLLSMAVAHFQHGFITKGDGINYVVRYGTDTFYIFCLPNQRWCGTSVPIGFGPWGNFRMAWGNPVCHRDGVTSGCLG